MAVTVLPTCLMAMHTHVPCGFTHSLRRPLSLFFFKTTGARDSINEPALNQIWFEMTTKEIGVSDAMLKPEVLQLTNVLNQLYQLPE